MTIRDDLPASQVEEALKLEARGLASLFKIELTGGGAGTILYLSPTNEKIWQSHTWEAVPCVLAGVGFQSSGEQTRPKFSIVNPGGIFSSYVQAGWVNNAVVSRYKVLTSDIADDNNSFQLQVWRVSKVLARTKVLITTELRGCLDGQNFMLPGRRFFPPEFPHVSLQ